MSYDEVMSTPTAEGIVAQLKATGYEVVEDHQGITKGSRIRHSMQLFPRAYTEGTGTVLALLSRDGYWSRKYDRADVEIVVELDEGRCVSMASYSVALVRKPDEILS